jgi:hypothetical protein
MRKARTEQQSSQPQPVAEHMSRRSARSGEGGVPQLKAIPSSRGAQLLASIHASGPVSAQRARINHLENSPLAVAQRETASSFTGKATTATKTGSEKKLDAVSKDDIETDIKSDEDKEVGSKTEHADFIFETYSTVDETVGELGSKDTDLSGDNMEWKDDGTKRSDKEQEAWLKKHGYTDKDVDKMKADDSTKDAVTSSVATALSFLKIPSMYKKFTTAENNYEKFEQVLEGLGMGADSVTTGSKIADAAEKGKSGSAQDTSAISEYTSGIIGLVKSGFGAAMKLKGAYEDYQLIKANTDGEESKVDGAKIAFEEALTLTSGILQNINQFQKSFGTAQNLAIKAAVPAISIALSVISLLGRIVTLVQQGKMDFGKTAEESQTDSIMSEVTGDETKKTAIKDHLQTPGFRGAVASAAEYRQLERDNPTLFSKYREAQRTGNAALKARLQKRYPKNYARIEEIEKKNKLSLSDFDTELKKAVTLGVPETLIERIIKDQTLINHLQEVKEKRSRNAKIGIFTDLVNIGGDIATLTGTGAVVGTAMKAGTAAIDIARKGGNAIKFAARSKGAEDLGSGAEKGLFGKSMYDTTDILKSDDAKKERYFHSARAVLESMGQHDKKVADAGTTPTPDKVKALNQSYGWVETKILGTGASATMVKAMANSDSKSGNDMVKYMMDKLKQR